MTHRHLITSIEIGSFGFQLRSFKLLSRNKDYSVKGKIDVPAYLNLRNLTLV